MEVVDKEEVKITLGRVMEISTAVAAIGENSFLDGTVAYRVGRLGDRCKSSVTRCSKERDKIQKEGRDEQKKLLEEMKRIGTDEAKREMTQAIHDVSISIQEKLNALDDEPIDFEMRVPDLKLSDFIAKTDITKEVNGEKIFIKTGQTLVPVKFFTLMGELIKDDKKTDA